MLRLFRSIKWCSRRTPKGPVKSQNNRFSALKRLKELLAKISGMIGLSKQGVSEPTENLESSSIQLISSQEQEFPERSRRILIPGTKVINHRQMVPSISHLQYQRWKFWIDANNMSHERAMATEPPNPISPKTGRPQHVYEAYQAKVPTCALVDKLEARHEYLQCALRLEIWEWVAMLRLKKQTGLREWSWAMGEPEESSQIADDEDCQDKTSIADESREEAITISRKPLTYAERVKTLTYTRGDDPMWKGDHYYLRRSNDSYIIRREGDFSNEVSKEDQDFVPKVDDDIDPDKQPRQFRYVYNNKEQEDQMALTATEFLFGGVSRVEERQMEAEAQMQTQVSREVETQVEGHDVPKDPRTVGVGGGEMQRFVRHRLSSMSGCSIISDWSDV